MTHDRGNGDYVTWGRWEAEHHALTERVRALEERVEKRWAAVDAERVEHRTRIWQAALVMVSGLVLPLAVLGVLALLHLAAR